MMAEDNYAELRDLRRSSAGVTSASNYTSAACSHTLESDSLYSAVTSAASSVASSPSSFGQHERARSPLFSTVVRKVPWSLQRLSTGAKGLATEERRPQDAELREYEVVEALCNSVHGAPTGFGVGHPHSGSKKGEHSPLELNTVRRGGSSCPMRTPQQALSFDVEPDTETPLTEDDQSLNIYGEIEVPYLSPKLFSRGVVPTLKADFFRSIESAREREMLEDDREWIESEFDDEDEEETLFEGIPEQVCDTLDTVFGELLYAAQQCEATPEPNQAALDELADATAHTARCVLDVLESYPTLDLASWLRLTSLPFQRHIASVVATTDFMTPPSTDLPVRRLVHRRGFFLDALDTGCLADLSESEEPEIQETQRSSGESENEVTILREAGDWLEVECDKGVYYFNEATRVSQWEPEGTPFAPPHNSSAAKRRRSALSATSTDPDSIRPGVKRLCFEDENDPKFSVESSTANMMEGEIITVTTPRGSSSPSCSTFSSPKGCGNLENNLASKQNEEKDDNLIHEEEEEETISINENLLPSVEALLSRVATTSTSSSTSSSEEYNDEEEEDDDDNVDLSATMRRHRKRKKDAAKERARKKAQKKRKKDGRQAGMSMEVGEEEEGEEAWAATLDKLG